MFRILYNISHGIPSPDIGGGARIIYEIMSCSNKELNSYFFSYLFENPVRLKADNIQFLNEGIRERKKIGQWLFNNIAPYKKITSTDYYKKIIIERTDNYFRKKSRRFGSYDIIHSHDTLSAGISKNLFPAKRILTIHSKGSFFSDFGNYLKKKELHNEWIRKMQIKEKENYFNSDLVTFPSLAAQQYFLSDLNIIESKKPKTEIIYNGIDLDRVRNILHKTENSNSIFQRYQIPEKDSCLKIINVGEHIEEKNVDLIIKAVMLLNNHYKKDSIFISIGSGPLSNKLKKLSIELSSSDKIYFLGKVPNEDVIALLQKSDFLVMLGSKVIFDMVIIEGLAVGISVIASKEGGNAEILVDGENGYLIENLTPENIAHILSMIDSSRVKQKAIKTSEKFSKLNMVQRYSEIYKELISEKLK